VTYTLEPGAWYNHEDSTTLHAIAQRCRRRWVAVELGGWVGTSSLVLADHFESVLVVDPWEGLPGGPAEYQDAGDAYLRFLANTEHAPSIIRFRCTALDFCRVFDGPADLVHIDHLHTEAETARSIEWALPLVRPGGVVCGHDYGHDAFPGVAEAVRRLLPDHHHRGLVWWKEVRE
jgi:SAM-dependent methyltransferase